MYKFIIIWGIFGLVGSIISIAIIYKENYKVTLGNVLLSLFISISGPILIILELIYFQVEYGIFNKIMDIVLYEKKKENN